jgi:hypothetical protein
LLGHGVVVYRFDREEKTAYWVRIFLNAVKFNPVAGSFGMMGTM